MALYVGTKEATFQWHVGERKPRLAADYSIEALPAVHIQADGDELELIRLRFPALTPDEIRVAYFPEPFADLIWQNL